MKVANKHVRKSFGPTTVLEDVSFTLKKGEIVGLLGRNGAGKSTLLKILAGINQPDSGDITIESDRIGYMSERNPLYPHMYLIEYLEWVAKVSAISNTKDRIEWVVDNVGLGEVRHKKIGQLSKGYKQRLGLAATLLPDPEILILDEPINGLDPVQINEYRDLIRSIAPDKIVLLSSHLMQEIEALCDRVLFLKDGVIAKEEQLKNPPKTHVKNLLLILDKEIPTAAIQSIPGVSIVEKTGIASYRLSIDDKDKTRLLLFDLVVDQGSKILEMTKIHSPLDNLFT